jgi:hypothetical protein
MSNQDSALWYFQRSYEYFNASNDKYQLNVALNGLADIQSKLGNNEIALGYYREAWRNGINYKDSFVLSYTHLQMAQFFRQQNLADSTIFHAQQSLFSAQHANVLENIIASGKLLSALYETRENKESLRYLKISQAANDSLFGRDKTMQLQNMFFNETEREREVSDQKRKADAERKENLEYVLIALGIVTILIIYLLLSRSFITSSRVIEFFGVIALLIVFEFLNLLLHPFFEKITSHSPIWMLIALVCIAALLVPLHHRLGKWITAKMVEKNKKIRLSNAKKTIEQLTNDNQ